MGWIARFKTCCPTRIIWDKTMQRALGQAVLGGNATIGGARHAQRVAVDVEKCFLLVAFGGILSALLNELAHRLDVVTHTLRFRVDVSSVAGDALAFFLEPLDPKDE